MITGLAIFFLTLVAVLVFIGVGRMVFAHVDADEEMSPLAALMAGCGVWYLWVLLFHATIGVSLPVVWAIFMLSAVALMLVLTKVYRFERRGMYLWPLGGLATILSLPILLGQLDDAPQLWPELSQHLKNAEHLLQLGSLPTLEQAEYFDIFNAAAPVAYLLLGLPVFVMRQSMDPQVYVLLNSLVLILAAAHLPRLAGIALGWGNLVFTAIIVLLAVYALNPMMEPALVTAAMPDVVLAGALFAACTPLMRSAPLPRGWQAFPFGLILAFLVGLDVLMLFVALPLVAFWIVRAFMETRTLGMRDLLGWAMLALPPVLAWLLWQNFTALNGFVRPPEPDYAAWTAGFGYVVNTLPVLVQQKPLLGVALLLSGGLALSRFATIRSLVDVQRVLVRESSVTFPMLITVFMLVAVTGPYAARFAPGMLPLDRGLAFDLFHLQFIILVPIAAWVYHIYNRKTTLGQNMRASGGIVAMMSLLLFAGLQTVGQAQTRDVISAPLDHTLQVAKTMRSENLVAWKARLGVLDSPEARGYYAVAMGYGLRHYAQVRPVDDLLGSTGGDFVAFHEALLDGQYSELWVHTPTPITQSLLGDDLRPDASYLYRVTADGLHLLRSFPHASYTYRTARYKAPFQN